MTEKKEDRELVKPITKGMPMGKRWESQEESEFEFEQPSKELKDKLS